MGLNEEEAGVNVNVCCVYVWGRERGREERERVLGQRDMIYTHGEGGGRFLTAAAAALCITGRSASFLCTIGSVCVCVLCEMFVV